MERTATIPDGVKASLDRGTLTVTGKQGSLSRRFMHADVGMSLDGSTVTIKTANDRRKNLAVTGTWQAHVRNMCIGVSLGWEARLKVVFSHFPIKVSVAQNVLEVGNFLGERASRKLPLGSGVQVEAKKDEVIVKGTDVELVGNTVGGIERLARVRGFDKRVFQDGIYLTEAIHPQEAGKK